MSNPFNNPVEMLGFTVKPKEVVTQVTQTIPPTTVINQDTIPDPTLDDNGDTLDLITNPNPVPPKEGDTNDLIFSVDDLDHRPEGNDPDSQPVSPYIELVNQIDASIFGGEMELYEGFDENAEPTLDIVTKLISHNIDLAKDKGIQDFFESFNPMTQRIVEFDLNSKGEDVDLYVRTLAEEQTIKSLDVTNELDQERIIRTWYQREGWETAEIDDKISDFKTAGLLSKEAGRIKPKLDLVAEDIAKNKEEEQRRFREIETQYRNAYLNKVDKVLSKDKIGDLALTKEESKELSLALIGDNTEIPLPNGKKITMPFLEALITVYRYNTNPDKFPMENLAQAALLLTKPAVFKEKYLKMARTEATNELVKDTKYDNAKKAGQLSVVERGKKEVVNSTKTPWNLKQPERR